MKARVIFLFCITLFFLSCFGNKKYSVEKPAVSSEPKESLKTNMYTSEDDVKELLYKNESLITNNKHQISFIDKINLGIPGGDNRIVRLSARSYNNDIRSNFLIVYAINNNGIEKSFCFASFDMEEFSGFNIMQDIPGKHIGNSTSSIGDFNGDGIDEIFGYGFYGRGFFITIWGYDTEKDNFLDYCDEIPFRLIDKENGPVPVEFITYNDMYGIKVFYSAGYLPVSPFSDPETPSPKNNKW